MNTNMMVISNSDYGTLCWLAGLGWGLWIATTIAAVLIDQIKWHRWVMGK